MSSQPFNPQSSPATPGAPPALPPGMVPASAPYVRLPKSPGLAAFLSLFPGLGQVYNGRIARAFVFFFAWVGAIYLTSTGHEFPFAFVIPFVYLFNIIDAWKGANAVNARFVGGKTEPDDTEAIESPVWGVSLALFGVLILLQQPRLAGPRATRPLVAAAVDRGGWLFRVRLRPAEEEGRGVLQ